MSRRRRRRRRKEEEEEENASVGGPLGHQFLLNRSFVMFLRIIAGVVQEKQRKTENNSF
jgi:hypothetical protein